ncbi:MAG: hypothetical protein CSA83_02630, partial [Actinomycetales bacterium]
ELIDRAATPALWCALTRQPDFDTRKGLPAKADRQIRVGNKKLGAKDKIGFFCTSSAALNIRGGYATIGETIHHIRVYQLPDKDGTDIYMMRVFATDLLRHRSSDLFNVELPPHSISFRQAPKFLRQAILEGNANYLGWLVVGDELEIDMTGFPTDKIAAFLQLFPNLNRWRITGFEDGGRINLRPTFLTGAYLDSSAPELLLDFLKQKAWRINLAQLWYRGAVRGHVLEVTDFQRGMLQL